MRPTLLLLLWVWAGVTFVVVDLFFDVPAFDRARPRSGLYRDMRFAAHEIVGEPIHDVPEPAPERHYSPCMIPVAEHALDGQLVNARLAARPGAGSAWRQRLDRPLLRAVELMEDLDAASAVSPFLRDFTDESVTNDDVTYRYASSVRVGSTAKGKILFREGGALYVVGDLGPETETVLQERGGVVVTGECAGSISIRDGTVYVGGDLTGTVTVRAETVLLIDGDLSGSVDIGSSSTVFVGGRISGQLHVRAGSRCRIFLATTRQAEELVAMPGDYRECSLYVPELVGVAEGSHELALGSWRRVSVGGEFWQQMR